MMFTPTNVSTFSGLPEEMQVEIAEHLPRSYLESMPPSISYGAFKQSYPLFYDMLKRVKAENSDVSFDILELIGELDFTYEFDEVKHDSSFTNHLIHSSTNDLNNLELLLVLDGEADIGPTFVLAATRGDLEMVSLLLQNPNLDPNIVWGEIGTALVGASESGHVDVVKLLLADPRVVPHWDDNAAIRYASQASYAEVINLLLGV